MVWSRCLTHLSFGRLRDDSADDCVAAAPAEKPQYGTAPSPSLSVSIIRIRITLRKNSMDTEDLMERITFDPAVMGGKPCLRGIRITVGTIVEMVANGHGEEKILASYPSLEKDDIRAALNYAAWRAEELELPLRAV